MKDNPTIAAIREVRHRISAAVGHDPRKLVEHYRLLQERHQTRLVLRRPQQSQPEGENDAQNGVQPDLCVPDELNPA